MSEPCKHERAAGDILARFQALGDHYARAGQDVPVCDIRVAMGDALASLAASDAAMEMATAELLAKDATIGRLDEDVAEWISRAMDAEATIERVRALLGDTTGPLWAVRGVREADLCAALEATS